MTFLDEARLGKPLTFPLEGRWTYSDLPTFVVVLGFPFKKARWSQACPGVLAQYRECCAHGSMHLKVVPVMLRGGVRGALWSIDHEDAFNPDPSPSRRLGRPFAHFFHDYPPGRIAKPAAVAGAGWGLGKFLL